MQLIIAGHNKTVIIIMNTKLLITISIVGLLSCDDIDQTNNLSKVIRRVETNLTYPIYIDGDSTWSIESRMKHYNVPGVSIAVMRNYEIAWVKNYGIADIENEKPVDKETIFLAGSISKSISAYGALKLVDQNKVELDENINTYLKSWKIPENEFTQENKVNLKSILNHTAGITVDGFLGYSSELPVPTLLEILNGEEPSNSNSIFVDQVPETNFRYSGGGYTVMQQMMIDVEKKPFPEIMEDLVLVPLNMKYSTYNQPLLNNQLEAAATGYLKDGSKVKDKSFIYPEMAAAGLWTTAEDLAKYVVNVQKSIASNTGTYLSNSLTEKMLTPFYEDGGPALGVFINKRGQDSYFFHNGWIQGFCSEFVANKKKGDGVVVLINANQPEFVSELIRSVALTYQWNDYVTRFKRLQPKSGEIKKILGRYRTNVGTVIYVYQSNDKLYRKNIAEKAVELIKISDTSFVSREDEDRFVQFVPNLENKYYDMSIQYFGGNQYAFYPRMNDTVKSPIEFLEIGLFDKALEGYKSLKEENHSDPAIKENNLNELGYHFLNLNNVKLSQELFYINTILYPNSSNAYYSYAEACAKDGDLELAMINYKKSITIDSKNKNAKEMIKELEKKLGN